MRVIKSFNFIKQHIGTSIMKLSIQGKQMDIGEALRTHITDKIEELDSKFFNRAISGTITLSPEGNSSFKAHIKLGIGRDIDVEAYATEQQAYTAFDSAAEKVAKQMRRYKRRLRDHRQRIEDSAELEHFQARDYVINLTDEEEERIITEWINYMNFYEEKFNLQCKIFHWGKAEQSVYNQVKNKFESKTLNFIDLLDVFKTEPIIVKDSFSYGLKDIVKALHKHGLIKEIWEEEMNGKEAMIQAWNQYNNKSQKKNNVMGTIGKYNYYDCKVIDEILVFIRNML